MRRRRDAVRRFLHTPKGLLLAVLAALVLAAAPHEGWARVFASTGAAVAAAGMLDLFVLRLRYPRWQFPGGAVLTALIVAMVLSPYAPWWVACATSVIAVASKYVLRSGAANVFNPAALGLVIAYFAFGTGQSWWGALPVYSFWGAFAIIVAGAVTAAKVRKLAGAAVFLLVYFSLFTVAAFAGHEQRVFEIFRTPDAHAALYFAFFMLTDPPTAPVTDIDQAIFATLVAVSAFGLFEWRTGVVYYLPAGLLVGNVWEAWRRASFLRGRRRAAA